MHKFVRHLITEWRKLGLPFKGETVVIAVSGGADSMSLLLAVHDLVKRKKFELHFVVAHFDHGLRGSESSADAAFVADHAGRLGFEFVSTKGRINRKGNLEQNARDARYAFLQSTALATSASVVLTGHTKNDQAETFLLNLIRGSGADGLAAMRPLREISDGVVLARPLLSWALRADTEGYCSELRVKYRNDLMNADEAFTRVRIRKTVLPILAQINPNIVDTLSNTANLLREQAEPRESSVIRNSAEWLLVKDLKTLSKGELYSVIRSWLGERRGNLRSLQLKHIEAIERLALSPKSGNTVELPAGGRVIKGSGRLTYSKIKVEK